MKENPYNLKTSFQGLYSERWIKDNDLPRILLVCFRVVLRKKILIRIPWWRKIEYCFSK